MVLLRFLSTIICAVLIATGAVSGEDVMKAVGDKVSFRPDQPLSSSVTSIIWKHKNTDGIVVKAIEWDKEEPGYLIPNQRFKDITKVDEKTGQITITNLKFEHSGVYTIDINSKEQQQRFTLTVKERVPKPKIKIEPTDSPDVVYLRCEYSEPIIWKNSDGETLTGSPVTPIGQSITVKKNGKAETFYTCTLDNGASKETSDRVYESDLFKDGPKSGAELAAGIVIPIILIIILGVLVFLYKCNENFKELVNNFCACFGGPKDKDPKLTGVNTKENEHLAAKDEGQQAENSTENEHLAAKDEGQQAENIYEGEPANTPAGTANSNENEGLKKEDKINEA